MASTIQYSLIRRPELLDVVDEEWEKDQLPTDDVTLPEGVIPLPDEVDVEDHQDDSAEKWVELGLNTVF